MKHKLSLGFILAIWLVVYPLLLLSCESGNTQPTSSLPVALTSPSNASLSTTNTALPNTSLPNLSPFDIGDGGFISEKPCGSPCFMGIVSGQTQKNAVILFLQEKKLQNCVVHERKDNGGPLNIICDPYLVFVFSDLDIVDQIAFTPSKNIAADEVMAKYGEPNRFSIDPHEDDLGNTVSVSLLVLYDKGNIAVNFLDQKGSVFNVTENTQVEVVGYYDQPSYKGYLEKHRTDPWVGYGEYQIQR